MVLAIGIAAVALVSMLTFVQWRRWQIAVRPELLLRPRPGHFAAAVAASTAHRERTAGLQDRSPSDEEPRAEDPPPASSETYTWSLRGDLPDDLISAGAVGAVGIADWWHVDHDVLAAVSHVTGEHISNAPQLWDVAHDHDFHLVNGLFIQLRGHVGEQLTGLRPSPTRCSRPVRVAAGLG